MTATMRALRAHDLIGPPGLWVDETPIPPRPDEDAVRIDVHAAGIGFVDTLVTRGKYQVRQDPPFIPGMEVAGIVESAPPGSGFAAGQRVYASVPVGGCAETVWAQEHLVAPLPDSLSAAQGAALVVNDHTAHVALVRRAGIRPGESVLVHGAAGGLGSAAVRVAAALGARVTAVASTPQRRAAATAAGAHQVYGRTHGWTRLGRTAARTSSSTRSAETCSTRRCGRWPRRAGYSPSATSPDASRRPRRTGCSCATAMSEESTGAA